MQVYLSDSPAQPIFHPYESTPKGSSASISSSQKAGNKCKYSNTHEYNEKCTQGKKLQCKCASANFHFSQPIRKKSQFMTNYQLAKSMLGPQSYSDLRCVDLSSENNSSYVQKLTEGKIFFINNLLNSKSQIIDTISLEELFTSQAQLQGQIISDNNIFSGKQKKIERFIWKALNEERRYIFKFPSSQPDQNVFLIGNFPQSNWTRAFQCQFDPVEKVYRADLKVQRKNAQFKFIFNGEYICSSLFKTRKDSTGNINNSLYLSKYGLQQNLKVQEGQRSPIKGIQDSYSNSLSSICLSDLQITPGQKEKLVFVSGQTVFGKSENNCEDASFIDSQVIGVADGVGGWTEFGISSADFSNQLMKNAHKSARHSLSQKDKLRTPNPKLSRCHKQISLNSLSNDKFKKSKLIKTRSSEDHYIKTPLEFHPLSIMDDAFKRVRSAGSSTCLIGTIQEDEVKVANLGDSGFLHMRLQHNEWYRCNYSKEQQHSFNSPYQLALLPKLGELKHLNIPSQKLKILENALKKEDTLFQNKPEDSDLYEFRVQYGDVLIFGTDGVFDNLFYHEIKMLIKQYFEIPQFEYSKENAQALSNQIAQAALTKSKQQNCQTPFGKKVCKERSGAGELWKCGKVDDITVVVSFVTSSSPPYDSKSEDQDDLLSGNSSTDAEESLNRVPESQEC